MKGETEAGSVNLLEKFLDQHTPDYDRVAVKNLRMMITLRSKKYPIHRDDSAYLNALSYFGFTNVPPDWQNLWATVLNRYLEALQVLVNVLLRVQ